MSKSIQNVFSFAKLPRMLRAAIILGLLWHSAILADEISDRRIQISLSVFPRIVAVDNQFRNKLTKDNRVKLYFVYSNEKLKAFELVALLRKKINNVAGLKFEAKAISLKTMLSVQSELPTGVFISEKFSEQQLEQMMDLANKHNRIVFSPFVGDVERGATSGIAITSRVKPFFNMNTLRTANIEINTLLMQISKRYE